ncbi:FtsW/RodA/SpoVE family cell cycle protein [Parvularcula sp. ZS-1/3]|uniref:Probable peptidoglycan glycosyltransferase FtsW n=1 Tax=Parvularcula mediterranea TaxID=2732508 RepID=A0A7Y3W3S3_9PROT|nr:FtsW/RodA/SpoVE family cell cycle protein [Parvularcula mediterranea]NNU15050.1 FtsW/RodA/SpoVE family cell cycle protein [Parvularcula mediterranea]
MLEATLSRLEAGAAKVRAGQLGGYDMALVYAFGLLALTGLVLSFAASPVAAARVGITEPFYFTERHVIFLGATLTGACLTAALTPLQARRIGILAALGALFLMAVALLVGPEIKGAKRWIPIGSFGLQPSEFLKPGFAILVAWFLSAKPDSGFPGFLASLLVYGIASVLLLSQPDYGQWLLLTAIWAVMLFVAGFSWAWIAALGSAAASALTLGYLTQSHVRARIDRFLDPSSGDAYQTDKAAEAIRSGGVFGHDLHEATGVKASLPDSQTDFVFAVAIEEFGLLIGLLIIGLFAVIAIRGLTAALASTDVFKRCAIAGLTTALCIQASINIGVNLGVLPAKGMTLPLISYGGSSMLATGFTAGLLLVLTRKRRA